MPSMITNMASPDASGDPDPGIVEDYKARLQGPGIPTFYPAGSVSLRDPYPDPAYCRRNVPRVGPICMAASFSPACGRPLTTRLKPGRVRPDWRSEVLCSGEPGACRHETDLGEPPEGDEQLAGERHDHHPTDPSTRSSGTLFKPF